MTGSFIGSPLHKLSHPIFDKANISASVKRDDLIHPIISGNKWRKLKHALRQVNNKNFKGILSFGGAYSNHIHALAYAGKLHQFPTMGIIRGEERYRSNATLSEVQQWGMKLKFVDRETYKQRAEPDFLKELQEKYPDYLLLPEGGSASSAMQGVGDVINELDQQTTYDYLVTPVGSGGTIAGLIKEDQNRHQILGISVLKNAFYLEQEIKLLLGESNKNLNQWRLLHDFHCGGYGKFSEEDIEAMLSFRRYTHIPVEPVYSGKMMLAILQLAEQQYFKPETHVVLLHTGGLQGLRGMVERGKLKADEWL